jgi:hypothetical protein
MKLHWKCKNAAKAALPKRVTLELKKLQYSLQNKKELSSIQCYPLPLGYERIYHIHIRKTAGMSLSLAFRNAFEEGFSGSKQESSLIKRGWAVHGGKIYVSHNRYLLERGDYFFGDSHTPYHTICLPLRTFKVTIFRDPVARVLSHYKMLMHWRKENIRHPARETEDCYLGNSFLEFLSCIPPKHLLRQLYMFSPSFNVDDAVQRIAGLEFILLTEKYAEHLDALARVLQLPLRVYDENRGRYRVEISDEDRARLKQYLAPEYELIERIRRMCGVYLRQGDPSKNRWC